MTKGRSVVIASPGVIAVENIEIPPMGAGQCLVRTACSLISPGTELAFFQGTHSSVVAGTAKYPVSTGYSNVGCVEEVGGDMRGFAPGDRVMCQAGHVSRYIAGPESMTKIPDEVADEQAVFTILASIALYGLRSAVPQIGESVLILGLGVIGQLALRLLRICGVDKIIAADTYPMRLEMARRGGADYALNIAQDDLPAKIKELTKGRGCEIVIEASGNPQAVILALQAASMRGRIVILGCPHGRVDLDLYSEFQRKDLSLIGAYQPNCPVVETASSPWTQLRNRELVLTYLQNKRLEFASLLTHRRPYTEAQAVYDTLLREKDKALAGILNWREA